MKAEVTEQDTIPAGSYHAVFGGVEDGGEGEFGAMWRWTFWVTMPDTTQHKLDSMSSATFGTGSKAYAWACGVADREIPPGEVVDFNAMKGLQCRVIVGFRPNGWNKIEEVQPAPGSAGAGSPIQQAQQDMAPPAEVPGQTQIPPSPPQTPGWKPPVTRPDEPAQPAGADAWVPPDEAPF